MRSSLVTVTVLMNNVRFLKLYLSAPIFLLTVDSPSGDSWNALEQGWESHYWIDGAWRFDP
jgi:hypothetical protein